MAIPALTPVNHTLRIPLYRYITDGSITEIADTQTSPVIPIAIARPADDDYMGLGNDIQGRVQRMWGTEPYAYLFDKGGTVTTAQKHRITFESKVAGTAAIAVRLAMWTGDCNPAPANSQGRWNPSGTFNTTARNIGVTVNGSSADYYLVPGNPTSTNGGPTTSQAGGGTQNPTFDYQWIGATVSNTAAVQLFTVARGTNVIDLYPSGGSIGGLLIETVNIIWTGRSNWQNEIRGVDRPAVFTNVGPARSKLAIAASRGLRILYFGDSLTANANNYAAHNAKRLSELYGDAGREMRLQDNGTTWQSVVGSAGAWTYSVSPTVNCVAWSSSYIHGLDGLKILQANTGNWTHSFTGTAWELIYEKSTAGGSFTWAVDGGGTTTISTAGTNGTYGKVSGSGLSNAAHTVAIAKTETSAADGIKIATFWGGAATGVLPLRLATAGKSFYTFFPTGNTASLASFLAAFAPDLIVMACANNSGKGDGGGTNITTSNNMDVYLGALQEYLPTLVANGAAIVWYDLMPFLPNGQANVASGTTFGPSQAAMDVEEFGWRCTELMTRGFLNGMWAYINAGLYLGLTDALQRIYSLGSSASAGGYATQSASGFTNGHPSAAGADFLGRLTADLFAGVLPTAEDKAVGQEGYVDHSASTIMLSTGAGSIVLQAV